jgi:hypothetical protein
LSHQLNRCYQINPSNHIPAWLKTCSAFDGTANKTNMGEPYGMIGGTVGYGTLPVFSSGLSGPTGKRSVKTKKNNA